MTIPETVSLPGGSFSYLAVGDPGAPLALCLHGFPDQPRSFTPLMAELAQAGYRAVAPWMRGYAPSTLAGPFHAERIADDAIELAAALSPDATVALVGHDWGALAADVACARAPERFSCAITLAVPHPLAFTANLGKTPEQLRRSWYMFFFQLPLVPEWVVARDDFAFIERLWRTWSPGYRLPEGDWAELKRCLAASMPWPLSYYRAMFWPPAAAARRLRPEAAAAQLVAVPTLQLQGSDDGCIAATLGDGQERFFKGPFKSERVDRAGHFLHLERPVWVAQRTLWWLKQHAPGRALAR